MKLQQKEYLRRQVNKTFDFETLVREITYIGSDEDNDASRFEEKTMKPVLKQIKDAFAQESGNTVRFRDQLKTLLDHGKHDEFLDRITKGREYYKNLLWDQVKILAQHAEDMRSAKRMKGYLNDLGDLDQLLSKKLEEVDKVFHLAEGILNEKAHFDFVTLKNERGELRSKILSEVTRTSPPPKKKRKKRKQGKSNI
jgi:uncharacterized membrane protein YgaE (UPF0421/DUF939 family)